MRQRRNPARGGPGARIEWKEQVAAPPRRHELKPNQSRSEAPRQGRLTARAASASRSAPLTRALCSSPPSASRVPTAANTIAPIRRASLTCHDCGKGPSSGLGPGTGSGNLRGHGVPHQSSINSATHSAGTHHGHLLPGPCAPHHCSCEQRPPPKAQGTVQGAQPAEDVAMIPRLPSDELPANAETARQSRQDGGSPPLRAGPPNMQT
jgi:hypothetical protein